MNRSPLEVALRRDHFAILFFLSLLITLAWGYLFWNAAHMAPPPASATMPGMDMGGTMAPAIRAWTIAEFFLTFLMWAIMMVGMMLPSAAPMILLYARVRRHAAAEQKPFAAAGWFAGGYILAWLAFSLAATAMQAELSSLTLLTPMMKSANSLLGGGILIAAGVYEWSGFKNACLTHCRSPLLFIQQHGGFKAQPTAALALGLRYGLYCVGCCWALMALLFAGGIMNIVWIAGLAVLIFCEKLLSQGVRFSRAAGFFLIAGGLALVCWNALPLV